MAKFTPAGWKMSAEGTARFGRMYDRINAIIRKRTAKYNLAAHTRDDLMQEARLAAAYAVDSYVPERGNLDGYISRVVSNALAMVAAEALAQSRQPYKLVPEGDGWRKVPISHVELENDSAIDETPLLHDEERGNARMLAERSQTLGDKLAQLRLSADATAILRVRLQTPPELWILARNINRGRMRLEANSICRYFGWMAGTDEPDRMRYQRGARELREQFRVMLGIDDATFEPLAAAPIPSHLQTGAKQRSMVGLR